MKTRNAFNYAYMAFIRIWHPRQNNVRLPIQDFRRVQMDNLRLVFIVPPSASTLILISLQSPSRDKEPAGRALSVLLNILSLLVNIELNHWTDVSTVHKWMVTPHVYIYISTA